MAWMESNGRTRPARPGRLIAGTPPDEAHEGLPRRTGGPEARRSVVATQQVE
jgi:hypothetical protein